MIGRAPVRLLGTKNSRTGGRIDARVETREEAGALIQEDPFFTEEIADYQVIEFQAVKFHSAIGDLV
jgi:hypothetical protein